MLPCHLPLLLPCHPALVALAGETDMPALSQGATLTMPLPAAAPGYPARHSDYFASRKEHHRAGAGRADSEPQHTWPGMGGTLTAGPSQAGMGTRDGDRGSPPLLPAHADGALGGRRVHEMAFWGFLAAFLTGLCLPGTSGSLGCVCPAWAWVSARVCHGPSASPPSRGWCQRSPARAALACSGDALPREGKGFPPAQRHF